MVAQLVSSIIIFATAILGCGGYFMRMEFKQQGPWGDTTPLAVLPWRPKSCDKEVILTWN